MMQIRYITELMDTGNELHELIMSGHAAYDYEGKDIVCSAASALLVTLAEMLGMKSDIDEDIQAGEAMVRCKCSPDDLFLKTCFQFAVTGLEMLAEEYPDNIVVN